MKIDYLAVVVTIINFIILVAVITGLYKAIKGIKNFIIRSRELDKRADEILNKLNNKENL